MHSRHDATDSPMSSPSEPFGSPARNAVGGGEPNDSGAQIVEEWFEKVVETHDFTSFLSSQCDELSADVTSETPRLHPVQTNSTQTTDDIPSLSTTDTHRASQPHPTLSKEPQSPQGESDGGHGQLPPSDQDQPSSGHQAVPSGAFQGDMGPVPPAEDHRYHYESAPANLVPQNHPAPPNDQLNAFYGTESTDEPPHADSPLDFSSSPGGTAGGPPGPSGSHTPTTMPFDVSPHPTVGKRPFQQFSFHDETLSAGGTGDPPPKRSRRGEPSMTNTPRITLQEPSSDDTLGALAPPNGPIHPEMAQMNFPAHEKMVVRFSQTIANGGDLASIPNAINFTGKPSPDEWRYQWKGGFPNASAACRPSRRGWNCRTRKIKPPLTLAANRLVRHREYWDQTTKGHCWVLKDLEGNYIFLFCFNGQ